jgi:hypothetical protein
MDIFTGLGARVFFLQQGFKCGKIDPPGTGLDPGTYFVEGNFFRKMNVLNRERG